MNNTDTTTYRPAVIIADEYREETARLMNHPTIRRMAEDIRADIHPADLPAFLTSWGFIRAAGAEFTRRTGTHPDTVGGPARAIAAILGQ